MTDHTTGVRKHLYRLRDDPLFFLHGLWGQTGKDRDAPLSEVEEDMYLFLLGLSGPWVRFRCILGWRGSGKTHLVIAAALWRLYRDINRRILVPSKSEKHAIFAIGLARDWIDQVWFLKHLAPTRGLRDSSTEFDVRGSDSNIQPSVRAIGIDGQLEGNRAHSIYPDDVESDKNTITMDSRAALYDRTGEFGDILYPDREGSRAVDPVECCSIGTRHNEDSVYDKFARAGWSLRAYPIAAPQRTDKIDFVAEPRGIGEREFKSLPRHFNSR